MALLCGPFLQPQAHGPRLSTAQEWDARSEQPQRGVGAILMKHAPKVLLGNIDPTQRMLLAMIHALFLALWYMVLVFATVAAGR